MKAHDIETIAGAFGQPPWNKPREQFQRYFQEHINGERLVLAAFMMRILPDTGPFAGSQSMDRVQNNKSLKLWT